MKRYILAVVLGLLSGLAALSAAPVRTIKTPKTAVHYCCPAQPCAKMIGSSPMPLPCSCCATKGHDCGCHEGGCGGSGCSA